MGSEGTIEAFSHFRPELLVTDVIMPEMGGYERGRSDEEIQSVTQNLFASYFDNLLSSFVLPLDGA